MQTTTHALTDAEACAAWEALWCASPQRTAFTALPYARALAGRLGLEVELLLVRREGDVVAGLPAWVRRHGPVRRLVVPPFTAVTGPLLAAAAREADVHAGTTPLAALADAARARYAESALHLHPSLSDVRALQWRGWRASPLYTYRHRVGDEGAVLSGWSSAARRTVRRHGPDYDVAEAADPSEAVALAAASYHRQERGLPVAPERLAALAAEVQAAGLARTFVARPAGGGDAEAGVVVLHDRRTAWYWIAGSRPGPAMTVLLARLLPRLHEAGIEAFDSVGANTPSIAEFKRRLGGVLTPYYRLECRPSRLLRLVHALRG